MMIRDPVACSHAFFCCGNGHVLKKGFIIPISMGENMFVF